MGRYLGRLLGALLGLTGGVVGLSFGLLAGWLVDEYRRSAPMGAGFQRFLRRSSLEHRPRQVLLSSSMALAAEVLALKGTTTREHLVETAHLPWPVGKPALRYALLEQALLHRQLISVVDLTGRVRELCPDHVEELLNLLLQVAVLQNSRVTPAVERHLQEIRCGLGLQDHPGGLDPWSCRILGVSTAADHQEIRRVYRSLAARLHPDTAEGLSAVQQEELREAFIRVRDAWDTLSAQLAARQN